MGVHKRSGRATAGVLAAAIALAGCAADGSLDTTGVSTAIGGVGAFVACRGLTDNNNATCAAVGAAGALVGYGVGRHLQNKRDREAREAALQRALAQETPKPVKWSNTQNKGASGTVTLTRTYTNTAKRKCRAGQETAKLPDGTTYSEKVTLCFNPKSARYEPA